MLLAREKENHRTKIAREKQKRNNSKGSVLAIKNAVLEERRKDYKAVKQSQQENEMLVTQHISSSLHLKKQKSLQGRLG